VQGEKHFPRVTEIRKRKREKTRVTSVFTYIYAVCKWHVDCNLSTKIITCQANSGVPGREYKTTIESWRDRSDERGS
jgi:hypothetical protein